LSALCLAFALAPLTLHAQHVDVWRTNADRSQLLTHQRLAKSVAPDAAATTIVVDDTKAMQPIEGFGFAMTGGSAQLIHHMSPSARRKLLHELFRSDKDSMGISYLRLSIGASDMNDHVYTYDDLPPGRGRKRRHPRHEGGPQHRPEPAHPRLALDRARLDED
jgi:glucosylceramidase